MTELALAKKLLQLRAKPPTGLGSLLAQYRIRIPVAVLIGAAAALCFSLDMDAVATLVIGMWVGGLLRDLRYSFSVERIWPIQMPMMDWVKIEEMAGRE